MIAAIAYPSIDPVLVRLGPFAVRWYGLAYVAGFVAAWFVFRWLRRVWRLELTDDHILDVVLASVAGLLVGARLGYVIFYDFAATLADPVSILRVWDGGMSFHGGLVGILVAGWLVSRHVPATFLRLADAGAVAAPIGLFLGRIANFINGELWGRVSDVPWAMVFPGAGDAPRHPSQLYEAGLEGVVLGAVMLVLARRRRPDGFQLGWFLVLYGVFRAFVELFREPDAHLGFVLGPLSMGQLLSLPVIALGVWLLVRARNAAGGSDVADAAGVGEVPADRDGAED